MLLEFDDFQLDGRSRELRRRNRPVAVEPKVLEFLHYLASQRGRLVSRVALEQHLWPGTAVSSAALDRLVKEARHAVGDDGAGQRLIETRRGQGYRFVAAVRECSGEGGPVYVGRAALLAHVDALLEDAFRSRGAVLLLAGEPGLGKTRTAEEFAERARLRGAEVATAWSSEAAGAPGYWPWLQALRMLVDEGADEEAEGRSGLDPALAELLGRATRSDAETALGAARFRLFDGVRAYLQRRTRKRPVAIVLDDLHWADAATLDLIGFLAHDLASCPLIVFGTFRQEELEERAPLCEALARLTARPHVECLTIEAFTRDETRAYVEGATGDAPGTEALALLCRRSGGNPLLLSELLRDGGSENALLTVSDGPGPLGVLDGRIDALSPGTLAILGRAASIGREFERALLARIVDASDAELDVALDEALAARVILRPPDGAEPLRFTHALLRDVVYDRLDPDARVEAHARIADALERRSFGEGAVLDTLAHHACEAVSRVGRSRAAAACARAGRRARAIHAYDRAIAHASRALDLLDPEDAERDELLLLLGEARRLAGDVGGSRSAFAEAAERAHARGDRVRHAEAALGFVGLFAYAAPDPEVVERLAAAAAVLDYDHESLRARLLGRLASELMLDPDRQRRKAVRREAWTAACNSGDLASQVEVAAHPDHGIWDTQIAPSDRLVQARDWARRCAQAGLSLSELAARVLELDELLRQGQLDVFDGEVPAVDRLARDVREPRLLWARRLQRFTRSALSGDLEEAERRTQDAFDFGRQYVQPIAAFALFARQLAILRAEQGRLSELCGPWERASAAADTPSNRSLHAWICAGAGETGRAREIAQPLLDDHAAVLSDEPMAAANASVLAEVCFRLRWADPVEALLAHLDPHAGMNAVRTYAACHGPVDYYRGRLEALRGRSDVARARFRAALALSERMSAPAWTARCELALSDFGLSER